MGCASRPPSYFLQSEAPYVRQAPDECGVACLQMVFEHESITYDLDWLQREVFVPALGGTTFGLMKRAAISLNAKTALLSGDNLDLAGWIEDGLAPIVYWGPEDGESRGHFVVVTGMNNQHTYFQVHNGLFEGQAISFEVFMSRWERGDSLALLVQSRAK